MILFPQTPGERIKWYRTNQGLSRKHFCELARINARYLFQVENNHVQMTVPKLQKIAQTLGVSCAHLLGEVGLMALFIPETCPAAPEKDLAHAN